MRALSLVVALAACGDQLPHDLVDDAVSGSRLKVEWDFYGDGSRQPVTGAFYDTQIHGRCTPRLWSDGETRCIPAGDEAIYTNADCTELVGRADVIAKPSFFLGYDRIGEARLPARLYYAGAAAEPVTQRYDRIDGRCEGPFGTPSDAAYFELVGEVHTAELVAFHDGELGTDDDLLGLVVRDTDDGLHVPLGVRDRTLDLACHAASRPDGTVCEPALAVARHYLDPACEQPAILVYGGSPAPEVVTPGDQPGCPAYHGLGAVTAGAVYQRAGAACVRITLDPSVRAYGLGAPLELPRLARTVEDVPGHRLQRIALASGTLRFYDDHMFDTATRADCRRETFDDVIRCVPATTRPATVLFAQGCTLAIPVAEVPERTCAPPSFASAVDDEGTPELRAIGDRISDTLYSTRTGGCAPYTPGTGLVLRALGPPLPIDTFVGGHAAGER